ncbi:type I restriction endonuclease subunit R, partial [Helicobacter pylori]
ASYWPIFQNCVERHNPDSAPPPPKIIKIIKIIDRLKKFKNAS